MATTKSYYVLWEVRDILLPFDSSGLPVGWLESILGWCRPYIMPCSVQNIMFDTGVPSHALTNLLTYSVTRFGYLLLCIKSTDHILGCEPAPATAVGGAAAVGAVAAAVGAVAAVGMVAAVTGAVAATVGAEPAAVGVGGAGLLESETGGFGRLWKVRVSERS